MNSQWKIILGMRYLVAFFVVLLFVFFDFLPHFQEARRLKSEIRSAQQAIKTLPESEKVKMQIELQKQIETIQEGLNYLKQATQNIENTVLRDNNIALVTLHLEDLATESEIELSSLKPLESSASDDYEAVPIEIGFKGEFFHLIQFLSKVENSSQFMSVRDLSITNDEASYPRLKIRLIVEVLFSSGSEVAEVAHSRKSDL